MQLREMDDHITYMQQLEHAKVGGFRWIDPSRPGAELYPATRALLDNIDVVVADIHARGELACLTTMSPDYFTGISINGDRHLREVCDVEVRSDDLRPAYDHARRHIDRDAA